MYTLSYQSWLSKCRTSPSSPCSRYAYCSYVLLPLSLRSNVTLTQLASKWSSLEMPSIRLQVEPVRVVSRLMYYHTTSFFSSQSSLYIQTHRYCISLHPWRSIYCDHISCCIETAGRRSQRRSECFLHQPIPLLIVSSISQHSYIANGLGGENGVLVIDMKNFTQVVLNRAANTATIGTGNRLGDIALALNAGGRAMPHGVCPYVGIGGHSGMALCSVIDYAYNTMEQHMAEGDILHGCGASHLTLSNPSISCWPMVR